MVKPQTDEELINVKMYLLLPMLLSAFERDKKVAQNCFKTPSPYISLINAAIQKVEKDIKEVKRIFKMSGIKVYEEKLTADGIEARYLCRGYHHDMSLRLDFIVAESSILMEKYLGLDISKYISPDVPGAEKNYLLPSEIKNR